MLVNLKELLQQANKEKRAIPCFNCFGFEDAIASVQSAESLNLPVILAVNKDMLEYMPLKAIFSILLSVTETSTIPVVLHLDHTYDLDFIYKGIDLGFTSVMFDGSQLPIEKNIEQTQKAVDYAKKFHVSVEAEVGSVSYSEGRDYIKHSYTQVSEVVKIIDETDIDALAISIGNIHRKTEGFVSINYDLLKQIETQINIPLVIHGSSGICPKDLKKLKKTKVAKFNIGTSLRKVFGETLRNSFMKYPDKFDRLFFMEKTIQPLKEEAIYWLKLLS